jgi:hypothetical protein
MTHILLDLADILDDACAVLEEERGQPLSPEVEELIARRIISLAKGGERDAGKLRAFALQGLVSDEYSLDRLMLM